MQYVNKNFIIFLWFIISMNVLRCSMDGFLPLFHNSKNKIYVIKEVDDEGFDDNHKYRSCITNNTQEASEGGSIESILEYNQLKKDELLQIFKNNDIQSLLLLLNDDLSFRINEYQQQGELIIPFYISNNKNDLIILQEDIPFECYQHLIAAGGGLTAEEYKLMHEIELLSVKQNINLEKIVRKKFVEAIKNNNFDVVQALPNIYTCLKYQDFLNYKNRFNHGSLFTTTFNNEMTCLHYAVMSNNIDMIRFFIKHGASINAQCHTKKLEKNDLEAFQPLTPLDFAIKQREIFKEDDEISAQTIIDNGKIIDLLLASKANTKAYDPRIQLLINEYISQKIQQPTIQRKMTMYQSIKNLLSSKSSKVIPT